MPPKKDKVDDGWSVQDNFYTDLRDRIEFVLYNHDHNFNDHLPGRIAKLFFRDYYQPIFALIMEDLSKYGLHSIEAKNIFRKIYKNRIDLKALVRELKVILEDAGAIDEQTTFEQITSEPFLGVRKAMTQLIIASAPGTVEESLYGKVLGVSDIELIAGTGTIAQWKRFYEEHKELEARALEVQAQRRKLADYIDRIRK
jgi:hypothetical protein